MNRKEQGFLLLTSHLGDPGRRPLTVAQLRTLAARVRSMERPEDRRELEAQDLVAMGYDRETAERVLRLLSDKEPLAWYVKQGARRDCYPITRVSSAYPDILRRRLGTDCPGCLWAKGDTELLKKPAIALVGSRDLAPVNLTFAREAGRQAALQGYVLVSGNARGADRAAQDACLAYGGQVISVVADALEKHPLRQNVLYLSEDSFDTAFSSVRALSRNRIIHSLGCVVLVAQCALGKGGTWDGTEKNLRKDLSPVFCFDDGSTAAQELAQMGAVLIGTEQLSALDTLGRDRMNFIDQ